jgi:hypothetical protein
MNAPAKTSPIAASANDALLLDVAACYRQIGTEIAEAMCLHLSDMPHALSILCDRAEMQRMRLVLAMELAYEAAGEEAAE